VPFQWSTHVFCDGSVQPCRDVFGDLCLDCCLLRQPFLLLYYKIAYERGLTRPSSGSSKTGVNQGSNTLWPAGSLDDDSDRWFTTQEPAGQTHGCPRAHSRGRKVRSNERMKSLNLSTIEMIVSVVMVKIELRVAYRPIIVSFWYSSTIRAQQSSL
jgi:hypothetical protein